MPGRIPEVLVTGSKILNMDIRRSREDAQPYVVFEREVLERSGASTLEEFFKARLPMNTQADTRSQGTGSGSISGSQINLRGLGVNQTLVLIDGRRSASINSFGSRAQPDLNGIPLAAVERIEILPTTASGIYGGGATGGVINVILRRDYSGAEVKATYDNTFDSDSAQRRLGFSAGFNLEEGKTNILLAGSYLDQNDILIEDRDFLQRGRAAILANNPGFFYDNSPVLGATTNIRSADGSNLVLENGTALNSPITYVPPGYLGVAAGDGGAALVANAGAYNLNPAHTAQFTTGGEEQGLVSGPTYESLSATIRRQFTPWLQAFVEGTASDTTNDYPQSNVSASYSLPADASTNPFTQAITVSVPIATAGATTKAKNESRRFAGGLIVDLPGNWMMAADYTWSRTRLSSSTAFVLSPAAGAAVSSGALDVLRDVNTYPLDFSAYLQPQVYSLMPANATLKDATLRASGPIWPLPAGPVTLSGLIEHREEALSDAWYSYYFISPTAVRLFPSRSQSVDSVYLEALVPIVSERNAVPAIQELELQIAGRHDEYTTEGSTGVVVDPTPTTPIARATSEVSSTDLNLALRFRPTDDLMVRASYGTGFLPPDVNQLIARPFFNLSGGVTDPLRGNEPVSTTVTGVNGGNPDLQPEDSESLSAGLILTPRVLPGLRLSVDWTQIEKTDNIASIPGGAQGLINNETLFAERVGRGANLVTDPAGWAGPIETLDFTLVNLARTQVEAYDVQLDYHFDLSGLGLGGSSALDFFTLATWQTHYKTQLFPYSPDVENVGIDRSSPLEFKANAGVTWTTRDLTVGWLTRYFDSYLTRNPETDPVTVLNQGNEGRVRSQIYHDLFARYRFAQSFLTGTEITLGVKNVFDTKPPFDAATDVYYSTYGDPRLASYYISLRHAF